MEIKINNWESQFNNLSFMDKKINPTVLFGLGDIKIIKSFISSILKEEEANWMAEIHEQAKGTEEKLAKIEKIRCEEALKEQAKDLEAKHKFVMRHLITKIRKATAKEIIKDIEKWREDNGETYSPILQDFLTTLKQKYGK